MTGPPDTLVIETSNPGTGDPGEVGLAAGETMIASRGLAPSGRHDDVLMPTIDVLCRANRVEPDTLRRVVVSVGPGGFSAIRIAVATTKMIALATGAGCVPVPSCRVAAAGATGTVAVALAGKRGSAWVRVYHPGRDGPEPLSPGEPLDAAGVEALHRRHPFAVLVADAHLPEPIGAWASSAGVARAEPRLTAEACLAASRLIAPVSPAELTCVYPREPEAVRKWRELGRA